jgi:hypothetical protein
MTGRGIIDRAEGAGDGDVAVFERLAHDLEHIAPKFGQFIEEQNPIVAQIDRPIFGVESFGPLDILSLMSPSGNGRKSLAFRRSLEVKHPSSASRPCFGNSSTTKETESAFRPIGC